MTNPSGSECLSFAFVDGRHRDCRDPAAWQELTDEMTADDPASDETMPRAHWCRASCRAAGVCMPDCACILDWATQEYSFAEFFDDDGRYLGPDGDGIGIAEYHTPPGAGNETAAVDERCGKCGGAAHRPEPGSSFADRYRQSCPVTQKAFDTLRRLSLA